MREAKVAGFVKVSLNDLAAVDAAITPHTVAVMLEPVQGEAGIFEATEPFLRGARTLTRAQGVLFIIGIRTGIGRTPRMFGFEHGGTTRDIMTLIKRPRGGVPLAALRADRDGSCFRHRDQGGTFCGNLLMAAGCTVIEKISKPGFLARVEHAGKYLPNSLRRLQATHGGSKVCARDLLRTLDLRRDTAVQGVDSVRTCTLPVTAAFRLPSGYARIHLRRQRNYRCTRGS